jgi:hypothetical protein
VTHAFISWQATKALQNVSLLQNFFHCSSFQNLKDDRELWSTCSTFIPSQALKLNLLRAVLSSLQSFKVKRANRTGPRQRAFRQHLFLLGFCHSQKQVYSNTSSGDIEQFKTPAARIRYSAARGLTGGKIIEVRHVKFGEKQTAVIWKINQGLKY